MLSVVICLQFLMITHVVMAIYKNECEDGWFGQNCTFQCHCRSNECIDDGDCPYEEPCQELYFGPACQYVDLLTWNDHPSNERYLVDHNDSTCNPTSTATSTRVHVAKEYPLTWFRLILNEASRDVNFTVTLNQVNNSCDDEVRFLESATTVDVFCNKNVVVKTLQIDGNIVAHLCSLYISAGRNMALHMKTRQAVVDSPGADDSSLAVDGSRDSNGSCTLLEGQNSTQLWQLTYTTSTVLYSIRIYFREYLYQELEEFMLQRLDVYGNTISNDTFVTPSDGYVFDTTVLDVTLTSSLTISLTNSSTDSSLMVDICEVETYGDVVCPLGRFGLLCEEICPCAATEQCNPITGTCTRSCKPGFYGNKCSANCHLRCLNDLCRPLSGNCIHCIPGYTGDNCSTECPAGKYGENCDKNCPSHCSTVCNHTNGDCSCTEGFAAPSCKECKVGLYGRHCNLTCPETCASPGCHNLTGACLSCNTRLTGPRCTDCRHGHYGRQCMFNCSSHCLSVCDPVHGQCVCVERFLEPYCDDCVPGYFGDECHLPCPKLCNKDVCHQITGQCLDCDTRRTGSTCEVLMAMPAWKYITPLFVLTAVCVPLTICCFQHKVKQNRIPNEDNRRMRTVGRQV